MRTNSSEFLKYAKTTIIKFVKIHKAYRNVFERRSKCLQRLCISFCRFSIEFEGDAFGEIILLLCINFDPEKQKNKSDKDNISCMNVVKEE